MVAKRRLGLLRWVRIILLTDDSLDSISFSWTGLREKNAISEPDIIAEQISRNMMIRRPINRPIENSPVIMLPRM